TPGSGRAGCSCRAARRAGRPGRGAADRLPAVHSDLLRRRLTLEPAMATAPDKPYDLFVSYAAADRDWVEGYLLNALTQAGVRCHSEATFRLGVPRLEEFERAVHQSTRVLLVFSSAASFEGFAPFLEVLAQSYGAEAATWPVIPLLRAPVKLP